MKASFKKFFTVLSIGIACLIATSNGAVILSTDLTGRTLNGTSTATTGLAWTTNGVSDPGQLSYSTILNQNGALNYFVPNVNVGTGGTWSTQFTINVTSASIALTNMVLTTNIFNSTGGNQTSSLSPRYTISVVGNTSGTNASGFFSYSGKTADGPFTGNAVLLDSNSDPITIDNTESWTFTIAAQRNSGTAGFFTGFQTLTLNGTVIPEPTTALLGAIGMLLLLRRRR